MAKIIGTFDIGDTGEVFIVSEWKPDPDEVAALLLKFAVEIDNWAEPMVEAREAFIEDTRIHFESKSDPYGRVWTPLEASYLDRKIREGGPPDNLLHWTGDLEEAATSTLNWLVAEKTIIFNVEGLPFYGPYHQFGSIEEGLQADIHALRTNEGGVFKEGEKVDTRALGAGRGHGLPQRMFIGADEDAIDEVEGIFDRWLDELIDKTMREWNALGQGYQLRDPLGRFAGVER